MLTQGRHRREALLDIPYLSSLLRNRLWADGHKAGRCNRCLDAPAFVDCGKGLSRPGASPSERISLFHLIIKVYDFRGRKDFANFAETLGRRRRESFR